MYVSPYYYICVLILLYMCPPTSIICPHTVVCVGIQVFSLTEGIVPNQNVRVGRIQRRKIHPHMSPMFLGGGPFGGGGGMGTGGVMMQV
jgi:hypothetical protein